MATVPVTRTWVAGEVVTAAYMNNNITAVLGWLLAPAIVQLRQIVAQSLADGAFTPLTFTAEDVDSTGMHSTSVNTTRVTAVYPGWYVFAAAASTAADPDGRRGGQWTVNGTAVNAASTLVPSHSAAVVIPSKVMMIFLNVGDYVEYRAYQNGGAALLTLVTAQEQSSLTGWWVSN